jgi:hypothetical protein
VGTPLLSDGHQWGIWNQGFVLLGGGRDRSGRGGWQDPASADLLLKIIDVAERDHDQANAADCYADANERNEDCLHVDGPLGWIDAH